MLRRLYDGVDAVLQRRRHVDDHADLQQLEHVPMLGLRRLGVRIQPQLRRSTDRRTEGEQVAREATGRPHLRPQATQDQRARSLSALADRAASLSGEENMNPAIKHVLQFFKYDHLPENLQGISKPFSDLANTVAVAYDNQETTIALRKLLEAKDAAVRAALVK
jgi:hypothetical protein